MWDCENYYKNYQVKKYSYDTSMNMGIFMQFYAIYICNNNSQTCVAWVNA